jgi:molybdate/tungstate transport system ATP-binding protein
LKLEIQNVTKNWEGFALKNINLAIADAEYLVLLGPTGAGKTLLLETIMGFHEPDGGRILMNGQEVTVLAPEKRGIGYVPQNSVLFPHLTVRQNIAFGLKMQGAEKARQDKTVDHIIDLTNLRSIEHRSPASLSGGEKQKVALARVLAIDSKLVLLDEPLASVDVETARQLRYELRRLHKEQGKTVIHVTHSLIEGFGLADKIALMKDGEIVQVGNVKELLAKPKNEFAARLLGYENIFRAKIVQTERIYSILDVEGVKLKVSGEVGHVELVVVRPEDITVELSPISDLDANVFRASILDYTDLGPIVMMDVNAGLPMKVVVAKSSFVEKGLETGKEVWLRFKGTAVKIIQ